MINLSPNIPSQRLLFALSLRQANAQIGKPVRGIICELEILKTRLLQRLEEMIHRSWPRSYDSAVGGSALIPEMVC